jgi:hypothetical protein
MRDSFADHVPDALLDAYAASTLAPADLPYIEEHLLVCGPCRARLVATETFARAQLRAALRRTPISRAAEEVRNRSATERRAEHDDEAVPDDPGAEGGDHR